jgi:RNA polymerase sigma-70 factor (ECF subfamily)
MIADTTKTPQAAAPPAHTGFRWSVEEARLVDRIREGDDEAYEALVRTYGGRMLAVARRLLHHEEDCADAVQEAFLSAFRSFASFEERSSLSTWLHHIVVNACLGMLRQRGRRPVVSIDELLPHFDASGHHAEPVCPWADQPSTSLTRAETLQQVRKCIDRLSDDYRTVLVLRDIDGLTTDETAQILETTHGVIKTRLHRARQALRALLESIFDVDGTNRRS